MAIYTNMAPSEAECVNVCGQIKGQIQCR